MLKSLSILFREASLQASQYQALALVLEWVVDRLHVDTCALYARNSETDELHLLAVRGTQSQELPPPSLAGLVAEGFGPVRLACPWHHPRYGPKPTAEQRRFDAYLGVPIIRLRKILGVLEVQRKDDRQFTQEDTSLLLTLASELQEARVFIERARVGLEEEGERAGLPPVGIMLEVPAAFGRMP